MPLQEHHRIVSVDDHLVEHPRVWSDRLPKKFVEAGPRIIETPEGHHAWLFEGGLFTQIGLNAVAGKDSKDIGMDPVRYEDMIPGCYDPKARLLDMDVDGVDAALCFPSFPGFAGGQFHRAKDKELALACVQAWNDFNVDEWCASDSSRHIPLAILPTWDVTACVAELQRAVGKGARTISFPDSPVPLGMPSFHSNYWEPLWAAACEADVPVSLHFGSSTVVPGFSFSSAWGPDEGMKVQDAPFAVAIALFGSNSWWTCVDLLFSGALQRHPGLKFILSEGGIGWIPYMLERTDWVWDRHRWYQDIDEEIRPSELFRKHFWGCFIDDVFGIKSRYEIGTDRLLIEVDYPHADSCWPNSRNRAAEVLADVPDDEVELIVETNARALLKFPR